MGETKKQRVKERKNKKEMKVPLSRPDITEKEIDAVLSVLRTSYLSLGPKLREFEAKLAKVAHTKYAVAVNSGTSALHLIIRSLGIKDGDEVITTPFSFISSANSILFERAKPVFVDILPDTYNMDPDLIENAITEKTKAILGVDVFGQPAEWDKIKTVAKKHNLYVIEDSCEAIGAEYKGRRAGSFGDTGAFAFYPNKQITTGEGGVIVTDNEHIAILSRSMRNQGRSEKNRDTRLEHTRLGYNYRISDINCALGISQLSRLDTILEKRNRVAQMYNERLSEMKEIIIPYISSNVKMSWFVYVIQLDDSFTQEDRDKILDFLRSNGIECRNYFPPIHLQPFYVDLFGYKRGDFPITESIAERTIALPFHNNLKEKEIDFVVDKLKEGISTFRG